MFVREAKEKLVPQENHIVRKKTSGNIVEIRAMQYSQSAKIQKISANEYIELSTGEVKTFSKREAVTRADNIATVRKTLANLRDIINCNTKEPWKCHWITLTYVENVTEAKRLYDDYRKFIQRYRYYLEKNHAGLSVEYITVIEPQARGAWHMHCIFIYNKKAPFIKNEVLSDIWEHGFVTIQSLKNNDNIGLYLTAYLADMELLETITEFNSLEIKPSSIKTVETQKDGKKMAKRFVKGARMKLYPAGVNIYRTSKNVKRPIIENMTFGQAVQGLQEVQKFYEKTIEIVKDDFIINIINYQQYNLKKGETIEANDK